MNQINCVWIGCLFVLTSFSECDKKETTTIQEGIDPSAVIEPDTVIIPGLNKEFVMGKFEPSEHSLFVEIDTLFSDRPGLYLQKLAYEAFQDMFEAAKHEEIRLKIRSATRNFEAQKNIWENKWTGATILTGGINASKDIQNETERALEILKYSSMPGTSRHHWGTDIDLNAFNNSWFETGEGKILYDWLSENAHKYGYCQPYTPKDSLRPNGYNEEKWHWSYIPLAREILAFAKENLSNEDIQGFLGSEQAAEIGVKNKYILGINGECVNSRESRVKSRE